MRRRSTGTIHASGTDRPERGDITADAPPQRSPTDLTYSEDLGGVVDPHDSDLIEGGGWGSWSTSERLAAFAAVLLVAAVIAVVVALLL